ncbi:ABC-2 type transport system ATP-binding protein [Filimonas zeae]|uniref:ABC transporter ATP-binding protein n=1 Tax=Filimonas zeae TaxID=1737353 RepID=A0A917J5Q3_9BACT|nr:ATP-binding cassette domain-containing protein [Filimonas zeae]MDR6341978.1 ABC-2 type transport system ATP-binding protein [Filimonas zeae]GGH79596.1 ABC transporter ATP-binding protein [Filimonas zeae]
MPSIVTISGLTKFYGTIHALDNVSFEVPQGSVFGILGPNGSGKTTLLGIITDVVKANAGSFTFLDLPFSADMRKQVGVLLETPNFYHYLSAERNLQITAAIKGRGENDIDTVLKKVNLYERKSSKFSTFSLGMKQRLAIAAALLGNPNVLILDEPTNGLDPVGIAEIRNLITLLASEGKTIIMASHLLDEVEKVCTHVAIMKKGKLLTAGHVDEVLANEDIVEVSAADLAQLETIVNTLPELKQVKRQNGNLQLFYPIGTANMENINRHCFNNGITLSQLQLKKKSLETKFIELTN